MAKIYVMPQALVEGWNGPKVPTVDEYPYRNVEGHGPEKAFRYNGFEKSLTSNPLVTHTYESDTYLRLRKIVEAGELAVGDKFLLGIASPEMTELDSLWVKQLNTIDGLKFKVTVYDGEYAQVEDEGIEIDFANAHEEGRWAVQPVQKYRYDNSADKAFNGENEITFLVAEVTAMPAAEDWFSDCSSCEEVPQFSVRVHYNDSCLTSDNELQAPKDVYDSWTAAIEALADDVIIFNDIAVSKSLGGYQ